VTLSVTTGNRLPRQIYPECAMTAAAAAKPSLQTEFVCRLSIDVAASTSVGETGLGVRRSSSTFARCFELHRHCER